MVCFQDFIAKAPETDLPAMPEDGIILEVDGELKPSDASTRSGSPSASSTTSDAKTGVVTWESLEQELLKCLPKKESQTAPSSPCILGSCPQRARPSSIMLPSDASDRTPMATPATSWSGITPASRPPLPRFDASQRTPNGALDLSFMASAMATSPTKRRHGPPMADASQRSPTTAPRTGPSNIPKKLLSTMGTSRSPAMGDASRRGIPTPMGSAPCGLSTPLGHSSPSTPLSTAAPSSPATAASAAAAAAAAEANAVATAAAAKAAAEAAAAAAAAAAVAAKTAAEAAAAAALAAGSGDASQRVPGTPSGAEAAAAPNFADPCRLCMPCDANGRPLSAKEMEAQLRAAAPESYED